MRRIQERTGRVLLACLLSSIVPLSAADNAVTVTQASQPSEIEQLKQMLADQQRQINELRQALARQQDKETDGTVSASAGSAPGGFPNLGQVASTAGLMPPGQAAGVAPQASLLVVNPQVAAT